MARGIRIEYAGAVYHVTARGNEKAAIYHGDGDRLKFVGLLGEMSQRHGIKVRAYCLMRNHYHLVVETPKGNLSRGMGWLQTSYTVWYNRKHQRVGHLFQGRYKAQVVETDSYATKLVEYVHLNPARIGIKQGELIPEERWEELGKYRWSSHRAYGGWEKGVAWLEKGWLSYYGRGEKESQREYRKQIRKSFKRAVESPWEGIKYGLFLGGEKFVEEMKKRLQGNSSDRGRKIGEREKKISQRTEYDKSLAGEKDERIKIWVRIKLGGERLIDVARELGYKDGSGVHVVVKRLESCRQQDKSLDKQLKRYEQMSIVMG